MMGNPSRPPIPDFLSKQDAGIERFNRLASKLHNLKSLQDQWESYHQLILAFVAQNVKDQDNCILDLKNQIKVHDNNIETKKTARKVLSESIKTETKAVKDIEIQTSQTREDILKLELEQGRLEIAVESKQSTLRDKQIAFGRGIDYFKKRLQCYLQLDTSTPEECTIVLYFFTSEKPGDKPDNFIRMNQKGDSWELLETKPRLSNHAALAKKLADTSDIQGFLCQVQKQFRKIKSGT